MEHEGDGDANYKCCAEKEWKTWKQVETIPGELKSISVTQPSVRIHQLILVWKT